MDEFWRMCLSHLENIVPNEQYKTWILPLNVKQEGKKLLVHAPNRFVLDLVREKYVDEIHKLGKQFLNIDLEIVTGLKRASKHAKLYYKRGIRLKPKPNNPPTAKHTKAKTGLTPLLPLIPLLQEKQTN